MSLRDRVASDIGRCFMRLDHFGEIHYWNGRPITCVPDEEAALKRTNRNADDTSWDNNTRSLLIHTPVESFPGGAEPVANTQIMFDDQPMRVLEVDHNLGVWDIVLVAPEPREF